MYRWYWLVSILADSDRFKLVMDAAESVVNGEDSVDGSDPQVCISPGFVLCVAVDNCIL